MTSLYQKILLAKESHISKFSAKTSVNLFGKNKLVFDKGSIELHSENGLEIDLIEITNLKGSYCFTKENDKIPKARVQNLKKTYEVKDDLFEYLKTNEYNCLENDKNSEILEVVGEGQIIINCCRDLRYLKRYLDFTKCKLVVYKNTAKVKTEIPLSCLRYSNENSIKALNELKFLRTVLSSLFKMETRSLFYYSNVAENLVKKHVILKHYPVANLFGWYGRQESIAKLFKPNLMKIADDLGLVAEVNEIESEFNSYPELNNEDYSIDNIPQEYLNEVLSEVKNKDFFKKLIDGEI